MSSLPAPWRLSSGRCSEAVREDLGSVPGHAWGADRALCIAAGCFRWVPLSSPLVGWDHSAPSSASACSSESCCIPLPRAVPGCRGSQVCWGQLPPHRCPARPLGAIPYPKRPRFSPAWGPGSADAPAQQICLGPGEERTGFARLPGLWSGPRSAGVGVSPFGM